MKNISPPLGFPEIHDFESALLFIKKQQDILAQKDQAILNKSQIILDKDREIHFKETKIQALLFEISRLKKWKFSSSQTEALDSVQFKLFVENLEIDIAAVEAELEHLLSSKSNHSSPPQPKGHPKRQAFPEHLERVDIYHEPEPCQNSACHYVRKKIGEEISEKLNCEPIRFFVERHIRPKYAPCCGEGIIIAPMPPQIIDKGQPAPGLLAHILISKFAFHLPLYRQEQDYKQRSGVEIPRNTMAGWVGACGVALAPLYERLCECALTQTVMHADETTVRVLVPGDKKAHQAYMWVYRTGEHCPVQAVMFDFQMSRAGKHPQAFLQGYKGALMIDKYSGYNGIFKDPGVIELNCLAHIRRKFFELYETNKSVMAHEALLLIGKLYEIEREATEWPPDQRLAHRHAYAKPILGHLETWLKDRLGKVPGGSGMHKAISYALNCWEAVWRYIEDGRYPIDNNLDENAIRPLVLGRKNWLFIGTEGSGPRTACILTLIESAKANDLNPYDYLRDVLTRLPTQPYTRLDELLPHIWKPTTLLP